MATRRTIPAVTEPVWDLDRSIRSLKLQLAELASLKGLSFREGTPKERAWEQITESMLRKAFRSNHHIFTVFSRAKSAGSYNMMGGNDQNNFDTRISALETMMNTAIEDLKMSLPEEELQGIYEAEDPFSFYNDLREILDRASRQIFIVDAYIDQSLFELYLANVEKSIKLRVLTAQAKGNSMPVAAVFANSHGNFEMRTSQAIHDRVVFVDGRCWVIGQSLKDAAAKKHTYMVEVSGDGMISLYEAVWNSATAVAKS